MQSIVGAYPTLIYGYSVWATIRTTALDINAGVVCAILVNKSSLLKRNNAHIDVCTAIGGHSQPPSSELGMTT